MLDFEVQADIDELVGGTATGGGVTQQAYGAYEGASRYDASLATWAPPLQSADMDMLPDKAMSDARSRDMQRNDAYVQAGANLHRDNIVGSMYMLNAKPEIAALGRLDENWATEFQQEVEAKFTLAGESWNCWFDATGTQTFTGLMRLAVGIYSATGEFLATSEWLRDKGRPFHTAFQFVDLDRLRTPWQVVQDQNVRGGVRLNARGRPLGYYISKKHPRDYRFGVADDFTYVKANRNIPGNRPNVIHLREQVRVDQTRGVSEMVAALLEMRITKKFRKVTLQNAVVNALYAASIESDLPSEAVFAQMGGQTLDPGAAVRKYSENFLGAVGDYAGAAKGLNIDGVKIPHLFPGTKLHTNLMGKPGGVGQDFEAGLLRYIASSLGVSYEQLSKDFSKTNYSSARAALTETWKFMQARKAQTADRIATVMYRNWFEEQMNAGEIESMKGRVVPNFYEGLNQEAFIQCSWIGASRGQIDELKETQAAVLRIKFGLSTHEDELAKLGKDYRKVYAQLQRENKEREERGIVLLEDNSVNAASGSIREQDNDGTDAAEAKEAA